MNKYEKAIKTLEHLAIEPMIFDEELEAIETAIDALKKQVPRARQLLPGRRKHGYCPNCGTHSWDKTNTYCSSCGQYTPVTLSNCIAASCLKCVCKGNATDDKVCERYAAKVDEIRRIHEEANNDI